MLARINLDYANSEIVKKLSREAYTELQVNCWGLRLQPWPETSEEKPTWYNYGEDVICDMHTEAPILQKHGIKFQIKEFKNTYKAEGRQPDGSTYHLHIAIPNIGLLSLNEVTWLEDACTRDLQTHLDEGWRILAVCPPNGTRRPDYILGRTKT